MTYTVITWDYVVKHMADLIFTGTGLHDDDGYRWDILTDKRSRRRYCIPHVVRKDRMKILRRMK